VSAMISDVVELRMKCMEYEDVMTCSVTIRYMVAVHYCLPFPNHSRQRNPHCDH
jgi:hypothetical protein